MIVRLASGNGEGASVNDEELSAAVVNLLLGDGQVTPKAIQTTAVELIRAGRLVSERKADGTLTVRRTPETDDMPPLSAPQELVMERVRHRCRGGVDRVPIGALGPGDGAEYWTWWQSFEQSACDEALALGLIQPGRVKSRILMVWGSATGAWLGFMLACFALDRRVFAVAVNLNIACLVVAMLRSRPRRSGPWLTAAGRRAARRWRNNPDDSAAAEHRLPARQVGATGPESALPVRGPLRIWSSYKNAWHDVDTAPLDAPRWGRVWNVVLIAPVACAVTIVLALAVPLPFGVALGASPVLVGALLSAFWLPAHRRFRAVPAEMTFRGAVISVWNYRTHYDDPPTIVTHYCCSVEHPASGKAWSFEVNQSSRLMFSPDPNPSLKDQFRVGDVVDVHCSPRRRKMHRISVVEAVPR
jgi:hypothetical protein